MQILNCRRADNRRGRRVRRKKGTANFKMKSANIKLQSGKCGLAPLPGYVSVFYRVSEKPLLNPLGDVGGDLALGIGHTFCYPCY